jgi:hypothetical protein
MTVKRPDALTGVTNLPTVLDMDLLWLKSKQVAHAFEVESTTTMTSGLQRGSNLPANVPKTMVIPEERERDHQRKMQSPLFSEHFAKDNWNLLFFDAFREAFSKNKTKTSLESLFGKKKEGGLKVGEKADRQSLLQFDAEEEVDGEKVAAVAELP